MTQEEVRDRAKFFYKYFYNMDLIYPVYLRSNKEVEEIMEQQAYDSQIFEKRTGDLHGYFVHNDEGLGDPTEAEITINKKVCKDLERLNETIIHELTHCALWWQGLESEDGQSDFENKLKELGLPSNWDITWKGKNRKIVRKECDHEKMREYEKAYQNHRRKVTC